MSKPENPGSSREIAERVKDGIREGRFRVDVDTDALPFINQNTAGEVLRCFNLDCRLEENGSTTTFLIDSSISALGQGNLIAKDYFDLLKDTGFRDKILNWFTREIPSGNPNRPSVMNGASVGIAAVLKAYEVQCGVGFMDNLKNILEVSPQQVEDTLTGCTIDTGNAYTSIGDSIGVSEVVEERQASLNFVVSNLGSTTGLAPFVRDGASAMYRILEKLWPDINSGVGKEIDMHFMGGPQEVQSPPPPGGGSAAEDIAAIRRLEEYRNNQ